ncbi:serine/threonine-protein kinase Nek6-like [Liolophura sinensis]|uniref:serine/threonine-protein kinase Nek6-like n=1 Tax=Liolophura sinensis TaxID=3198878 RepID=UPI0031590001
MDQSFNPVTGQFEPQHLKVRLQSLQKICLQAIGRAVTILRYPHVKCLPLPPKLLEAVQSLEMADFYIDPEHLRSSHHLSHSYPATCTLDNQPVTLKVTTRGTTLPESDPSYITTFNSSDKNVHVFRRKTSLREIINKHKREGAKLEPEFVWSVVSAMAGVLQNCHPSLGINPDNIYSHHNGIVTIDMDPPTNNKIPQDLEETPVYDSPEVLLQQDPDSRALSWVIGCILYEMLAMKPAYYVRSDTSLLEVMQNIIQGEQPPPLGCGGKFNKLITYCLSQRESRISLEGITKIANKGCE